MTIETYTQRLAKVREAIDGIVGGSQSWRLNGQQYTRADLGTLRLMERDYARLAMQEEAAGKGRRGRNRLGYIRF